MPDRVRLKFWGVRGSFPRANMHYMTYGGNTSCMSLDLAGAVIVFDAGSGIAELGVSLAGDRRPVHILLGHLHLDHICGLCQFAPLYEQGREIHIYGWTPDDTEKDAQGNGKTDARNSGSAGARSSGVEEYLGRLLSHPYWPVSLKEMPASVYFHSLCPGDAFPILNCTVSTAKGNHPDGCILYRIDMPEGSVVYTLDCETDSQMRQTLVRFADGADILVWDASYSPAQIRPGWGHSSWEMGIRVAEQARVRRAVMSHYSWDYDDDYLQLQERRITEQYPGCVFAREGMEITL